MADNVLVNPGTTTPIKTDDVGGGVQIQEIKVNIGAKGVEGDVWNGDQTGIDPGDDLNQDRKLVEHRYSYGVEASADQLHRNGPGFIHALLVDCTVAGTFVLRDSLTAGAGTIMKSYNLIVGPYTIPLDVSFSVGLYFDFGTATATINSSSRLDA